MLFRNLPQRRRTATPGLMVACRAIQTISRWPLSHSRQRHAHSRWLETFNPIREPLMRSISSRVVTVSALAAIAATAPRIVRAQQERFSLGGGDVGIYNLVGSIRAVSGSGGDVIVTVAKSGKDAGQLRVEQGPINGRQTLRVIYPARRITFADDDRRWGGRTTIRVEDDGTFDDHGDEGSRVEISSRSGGLEARADLTVAIPAGKQVSLRLAAGEVNVTNVNGEISIGVEAARVTTKGTSGALSLNAGSGEVSITDAEGDVSLDTGSGGITLGQIRGGRLAVNAGSGRLSATDITAKDIDIDLGSGGATLRNVTATDVKLDCGSGSTEIDLASDIRLLDIDAGSGGVTVWIPATLGAKVDIEAGSGGIDLGVPVTVSRWDSDHVVGTIGDGQGTIRIDAGSGGVRLKKRP
jgi:lia operon protein LiaG